MRNDPPLQSVFCSNAPAVSLLAALDLPGGRGIEGAKGTLARAAAAALLNSLTFDAIADGYPLSEAEVISQVTYEFNYGTRDSMLSLASTLNGYNNYGPPAGWPPV